MKSLLALEQKQVYDDLQMEELKRQIHVLAEATIKAANAVALY
jgi:hypothetical protein